MSKRRIGSLPTDCPAWLAEWIGGMNTWQGQVDAKLDEILRNGKTVVNPSNTSTNPGVVTWKGLAGKILIPLLLTINTLLIGAVLMLIGGN